MVHITEGQRGAWFVYGARLRINFVSEFSEAVAKTYRLDRRVIEKLAADFRFGTNGPVGSVAMSVIGARAKTSARSEYFRFDPTRTFGPRPGAPSF